MRKLLEDVDLDVGDLHQAVIVLRRIVHTIDATAPLFPSIEFPDGLTATTWYYAVDLEDRPHRVPRKRAEALLDGDADPEPVPVAWHRHPGGVCLVGVVVWLLNRRPVYIERVGVRPRLIDDRAKAVSIDFGRPAWQNLASELLRRARAGTRGMTALAVFLSHARANLPIDLASQSGDASSTVHWQWMAWRDKNEVHSLWDLGSSTIVAGRKGSA